MRQIVVTTTTHDVEARRALLMMRSVSLKLTLWSILWDLIVTRQIVDFDRALKRACFLDPPKTAFLALSNQPSKN